MDDIIVLANTRWQLRRAITTINQHFERCKLKQHPDKTTIGRVVNGFDFLGYQFGFKKPQCGKTHTAGPHRSIVAALLDEYRQHWKNGFTQACHLRVLTCVQSTLFPLLLTTPSH